MSLGAPVRTYKPWDLNGNNIETLREGALRWLEVRGSDPLLQERREAIREIAERIGQLPTIRDRMIREVLACKIRAEDLAEDAGLSVGRIYQIRVDRR